MSVAESMDLRRLPGKIAIVTGGSSGIGKACVDLFVLHGAKVIAIDPNVPQDPETPFPPGVHHVQGSVTEIKIWQTAMLASETHFGTCPDVLVQSAGIPGREKLLDTTLDAWDRVFSVNSTAVMQGMQIFVRALIKAGKPGSIVNVSSLAGVVAMGGGFAYEASKAACTHMTKTAAMEFAPPQHSSELRRPRTDDHCTRSEASKQYMLDRTPLRRWGTATETAQSVLYFASDESSYVTGQTLCHDGGYSAA